MNLWFIIGSISAIIPLILIKEYILNKNIILLFLALLCYLLLMISYLNIFNTNKVSTSYTIIQIIQILIVLLFGIIVFKEKINFRILLGILLAFLSIYFLS